MTERTPHHDWRILGILLSIVFAYMIFKGGLTLGQADRVKNIRNVIIAERSNCTALLTAWEQLWPCRAWGPDMENLTCTIRERRVK